jgi:hypothetical protein
MFQRDTWIFAAPDPAVVGIDLTTDMKCALITENYVGGIGYYSTTCMKLGVFCYIMTVQNVVYVLCINLYKLSKL